MENQLITSKQVELVKGKLNTLKIPVMINSQTAKFIIESAGINSSVIFYVKNADGKELTKEIQINSPILEFDFVTNEKEMRGDYLFIGMQARSDVSFALSITEKAEVLV